MFNGSLHYIDYDNGHWPNWVMSHVQATQVYAPDRIRPWPLALLDLSENDSGECARIIYEYEWIHKEKASGIDIKMVNSRWQEFRRKYYCEPLWLEPSTIYFWEQPAYYVKLRQERREKEQTLKDVKLLIDFMELVYKQ